MAKDDNIIALVMKCLMKTKTVLLASVLVSILISGISIIQMNDESGYYIIDQQLTELDNLREIKNQLELIEDEEVKEETSLTIQKRINELKKEINTNVSKYIDDFNVNNQLSSVTRDMIKASNHYLLPTTNLVSFFIKNFVKNFVYSVIIFYVLVLVYIVYKPTIDENTFKCDINCLGTLYSKKNILNTYIGKLNCLNRINIDELNSKLHDYNYGTFYIVSSLNEETISQVLNQFTCKYEIIKKNELNKLKYTNVLFIEKADTSKVREIEKLKNSLQDKNEIIGGIIF